MSQGQGREHFQVPEELRNFQGDKSIAPRAGDATVGMKGNSTNHDFAAVACGLGRARLWPQGSIPYFGQAISFYLKMASFGHQADGVGYRNEGALTPEPHAKIWMVARLSCLHEAIVQRLPNLLELVLDELAQHIAICRFFWFENAGVRAVGTRAKVGGGPNPYGWEWKWDSLLYAHVAGAMYGPKISKDERPVEALLLAHQDRFPEILERSRTVKVKLAVPVRMNLLADGGKCFMIEEDYATNQGLAAIAVDAAGKIFWASSKLATIGLDKMPVFLNPHTADETLGADAPLAPAVTSPTAPDQPPAVSLADQLKALAARVGDLKLAESDHRIQSHVVGELMLPGVSMAHLVVLADLVSAFGVGPGQPQKAEQLAIVAELLKLASP